MESFFHRSLTIVGRKNLIVELHCLSIISIKPKITKWIQYLARVCNFHILTNDRTVSFPGTKSFRNRIQFKKNKTNHIHNLLLLRNKKTTIKIIPSTFSHRWSIKMHVNSEQTPPLTETGFPNEAHPRNPAGSPGRYSRRIRSETRRNGPSLGLPLSLSLPPLPTRPSVSV